MTEEQIKRNINSHNYENIMMQSICESADNSWEAGYRRGVADEEEYYDAFCMQHDLNIKAKVLKLFEEQMDYLVRKGSIYDNAAIEHVKETFKTKLYD